MRKPFILTVIFFVFCSQIFSQQVTLRFQPEKGKVFKYLISIDGTITQSKMGKEQVTNSKTEGRYSYFVQNVSPKGDVEIIVSIESIKTSIKSQDTDTTFSVPLGLKAKQTLDKYGKIVKFEIIEMGNLKSPEEVEKRIDKRMYSRYILFPEKSISPGDEWAFSYTDTNTTPGAMEQIMKTTGKYKFNGVEEKNGIRCAKLSVDENISLSGQSTAYGISFEGEGKSKGTLWIDLKSGVLVHMETDTEMKTTMGISGPIQMKFPSTQKLKTVVTLSK